MSMHCGAPLKQLIGVLIEIWLLFDVVVMNLKRKIIIISSKNSLNNVNDMMYLDLEQKCANKFTAKIDVKDEKEIL